MDELMNYWIATPEGEIRQGTFAEYAEWSQRRGDSLPVSEGGYVVARDVMPGESLVSTVLLGMNHGFGGVPLIFETMVFSASGNGDFCQRYSTLQEARQGHAEVVARLSEAP
jgi:hypothetical protein